MSSISEEQHTHFSINVQQDGASHWTHFIFTWLKLGFSRDLLMRMNKTKFTQYSMFVHAILKIGEAHHLK